MPKLGSTAIVGVGVDILFIPRLRSLLARHAKRIEIGSNKQVSNGVKILAGEQFARRIMHSNEYKEWSKYQESNKQDLNERQINQLAKVWAVKEAAFKAISSVHHPRQLNWHDAFLTYIEGTRRPILKYTTELQDEWIKNETTRDTKPPRLHLSISHDGDYVTAFVVAENDNSG